jgi:hypothetical protein
MSDKPKRGGLRDPAGGRPQKSDRLRRVRCGDMTIPQWLHDWLMEQPEPAGHIVDKVLIEKFNLEPPRKDSEIAHLNV